MLRTGKWIALILWGIPLLAASTLGQTPAPAHQRNLKMVRKPTAQPQASMPALRTGPLPQVPMDQIPSTAPQVSYQEGMLSIAAQNSSLGDILREVHKRTGATIDIPPNANERVVTHLGPGPARDVLASLLNGSGFNYVMVGSTSDPTSVASIILTTKAPGGGGETVAIAQPPQQYIPPAQAQLAPGMGPGGPVVQPGSNDDEADAEDADAEENADQDQADGTTNATAPDGSQPPNGGPKTPEQILEMLRQRQQTPPGQIRPGPQVPQPNQQPPDTTPDNTND
ncbi:MAG TPA: hypothetical protein VEU94_00450 [Terriglobales bacterium]|nr:hypothetical protein [Terriglobales bacterium]